MYAQVFFYFTALTNIVPKGEQKRRNSGAVAIE